MNQLRKNQTLIASKTSIYGGYFGILGLRASNYVLFHCADFQIFPSHG
jgi:hypothetical protein